MTNAKPKFELRLADNPADLHAAQRLRYEVFINELGGDGEMVDHDKRIEADEFDPYFDHLLLFDTSRPGGLDAQIVGVYRLLRSDAAAQLGKYYSESEYDITPLKQSGRKLLELGRSCVHRDYRGGTALMRLWQGLSDYVDAHEIEILFGVASFHGTDISKLAEPLSLLHHRHLAPKELRVRARDAHFQSMDLIPEEEIDRKAAIVATPSLIKAYLRLGGFVGEGAFVDTAFNTTDVCLILDTALLNPKQRKMYSKSRK